MLNGQLRLVPCERLQKGPSRQNLNTYETAHNRLLHTWDATSVNVPWPAHDVRVRGYPQELTHLVIHAGDDSNDSLEYGHLSAWEQDFWHGVVEATS